MSALTPSRAPALLALIVAADRAGRASPTTAPGPRCRASRSRRSRWPGSRGSCRSPPSSSASASAPASPGMLQSTLGNLPELFVVIFALQKGELVVAQTAIVGSILANALLVLGLVIVVGARRAPDGIMRFSKRLPRDTATLLQVTVFIIVLLGLSLGGARPGQPSRQDDLGRRRGLPARRLRGVGRALPARRHAPARRTRASGRSAAGAAPARCAVHAHAARSWPASARRSSRTGSSTRCSRRSSSCNISQAFAGLVIVAIAGNAVENAAGLVLACEGPLRPRDLGRQKLRRADRRVPVPAARADLLRARRPRSRSRWRRSTSARSR